MGKGSIENDLLKEKTWMNGNYRDIFWEIGKCPTFVLDGDACSCLK